MGIRFAGGTIVNDTFVQSTGTKTELADQIKSDLVTAGWTATGSSGTWTCLSATTPDGLRAGVQILTSATNCVTLKWQNAAGSKIQAGLCFLLPAAAKSWRIIANQYHLWVFTPGVSAPREFACGGTLYAPAFNGVTEAIFGAGNAQSDTDTAVRPCLRNRPGQTDNTTAAGNWWADVNGAVGESSVDSTTNRQGALQLFAPAALLWSSATTSGSTYRWLDGSFPVAEALIACHGGGANVSAEAKIIGQLWDAFWASGDFSTDAEITYASHTFHAITNLNIGANSAWSRGALFVAIN